MNMKIFLFLILIVVFSSCCDTYVEVTYEYEDVMIKRVDECGISTFYYGINDGFSGYLVFGENQKVIILSGDGYFQSENIDTAKLEYNRISYEDVPLGKGVYYIMLATNLEKERNMNTGNGVKVEYMD
jgi:hypothetical protein